MTAEFTELLHLLLATASAHRGWIGAAIGLLAFAESLAVVGTIIPATPMLLLIGTVIGQGMLRPIDVVPWAFAGAVTGYWLSWLAGRHLTRRAYALQLVRSRRRSVARVRLVLQRWGGIGLVVGRFALGPLQSMLPLVAGAAGMSARRFHAWNLLSGAIWVPVVLAPGYLVGRGLVPLGVSQDVMAAVTWALALLSLAAVLWTILSLRRRRPT